MSSDEVAADTADAVAAAMSSPGAGRDAGPAGRHVLAARPRAGAAAPVTPTAPTPVDRAELERIAKMLRSDASCAVFVGGRAMTAEGTAAAAQGRGRRRGQAAPRDLPGSSGAGGGHPRHRAPHLPGRVRPDAARRRRTPHPGRHRGAGLLLRLSRQALADRAPTTARSSRSPTGPTTPWKRSARSPTSSVPTDVDGPARQVPERPTGPLDTAQLRRRRSPATLPDDAIVVDESNTSGLSLHSAHGRVCAARLVVPHRRLDRDRPAARHRRRDRPLPTARCSPSIPTDRRCTRSRPCGRWRTSRSTSPS